MKRNWTDYEAKKHIADVNRGRIPFGLTFCSACDYLKIKVSTMPRLNKENRPG